LTTISFDLNASVGQFISAKRDLGVTAASVVSATANSNIAIRETASRAACLFGGVRLHAGQLPGGGSSAFEHNHG